MEINSQAISTCNNSRWHDVAYWGLMLVAYAVMLVLNMWTSFKEDDMEFSLLGDAGFVEFWRAQLDHYLTSNGRCSDLFATLFCAYLGKPLFNVVNTLVFALLAHLVSLLSTGRRSMLALSMFIAVVGTCYPVPGQTMLFVAGSCNYMWAIVASLQLVLLLRRYHGKRPGTWRTALILLLALVAGNLNEATSFGFLGGMVLYYLFNLDRLDRLAVMALVAYLAGVLLIVASPAAWQRASSSVVVNMGAMDLLKSRAYIFSRLMYHIMTPVVAVLIGGIVLLSRGVRPLRQCVWTYILPCMIVLMIGLGYPYDRAYAPMATVGLIVMAMAADALLARWPWARVAAIIACLILSVVAYPPEMKVLRDLKAFEDRIAADIQSAPRQAVLHEYKFVGSNHFATPMMYNSSEFFNRESTYRGFYGKDNVQFVSDSVYARYHTGRLMDGAALLPLVSDRPEIADKAYAIPGQDYMVIVINRDTLPASPQLATYHLSEPAAGLSPQEIEGRKKYGLETDFVPHGCYPLYHQGQLLLVLPLIDENTSRITIPLDNDGTLGEMTLSRQAPLTRPAK